MKLREGQQDEFNDENKQIIIVFKKSAFSSNISNLSNKLEKTNELGNVETIN
ncbi:MAG: hypothetical protein K8S23_02855 [Candidatus Cloacimonetes bacterium]|nr:hypothetical protein [Candidatus Cloacimonadota bacterium]